MSKCDGCVNKRECPPSLQNQSGLMCPYTTVDDALKTCLDAVDKLLKDRTSDKYVIDSLRLDNGALTDANATLRKNNIELSDHLKNISVDNQALRKELKSLRKIRDLVDSIKCQV